MRQHEADNLEDYCFLLISQALLSSALLMNTFIRHIRQQDRQRNRYIQYEQISRHNTQ